LHETDNVAMLPPMAGGAAAGILIANNIKLLTAGINGAKTSWKELEPRGLTLTLEPVEGAVKKTSGPERPVLRGNVSGCEVEIAIRSDFVHYGTTEVSAIPPSGADFKAGVHPSPGGILGSLRSWLGQDIIVGDEAFDAAFLVTGKPEEDVKALLGPGLRELIITAFETGKLGSFNYTKDRVSVVVLGAEADPKIIATALDLACAAATWTKP
jgi:hypothetical protein